MLLSPNLTLKQAVHSQTAIRKGIDNSISKDDCEHIVLHQSSRILKVVK